MSSTQCRRPQHIQHITYHFWIHLNFRKGIEIQMLLTKFYYAECSLLLSGNTRRVAVFQFHAYANQPWHSSFWRDIWNPRIFHWLFLFFQMKEDVLCSLPDRAAMKIRKKEQAGGQVSGWTDRYPLLLSSSHLNFWVHWLQNKKKSMFCFKKCCLENYIHFGNSSNHGRFYLPLFILILFVCGLV